MDRPRPSQLGRRVPARPVQPDSALFRLLEELAAEIVRVARTAQADEAVARQPGEQSVPQQSDDEQRSAHVEVGQPSDKV